MPFPPGRHPAGPPEGCGTEEQSNNTYSFAISEVVRSIAYPDIR